MSLFHLRDERSRVDASFFDAEKLLRGEMWLYKQCGTDAEEKDFDEDRFEHVHCQQMHRVKPIRNKQPDGAMLRNWQKNLGESIHSLRTS